MDEWASRMSELELVCGFTPRVYCRSVSVCFILLSDTIFFSIVCSCHNSHTVDRQRGGVVLTYS